MCHCITLPFARFLSVDRDCIAVITHKHWISSGNAKNYYITTSISLAVITERDTLTNFILGFT